MDGVNYAGICDLARQMVLEDIKGAAQDRMIQGEMLNDKGFLSWGIKKDKARDDEAFGALESYLNYLHYVVEQAHIPLHVNE
jgi:hypothetical protein